MKINELTISHNEYLYASPMVAMEFYSSFNPLLSFKTINVNTIRKKCNDTNRGPLVFFRINRLQRNKFGEQNIRNQTHSNPAQHIALMTLIMSKLSFCVVMRQPYILEMTFIKCNIKRTN